MEQSPIRQEDLVKQHLQVYVILIVFIKEGSKVEISLLPDYFKLYLILFFHCDGYVHYLWTLVLRKERADFIFPRA